jgi:hypothetical protein
MATTNPITGDLLVSKTLSETGEKNYEAIFGAKKKKTNGGWTPPPLVASDLLCDICGKNLKSTQECAWTGCPLNWDEKRADVIGTNGNDGLHY